MTKVQGGGMVPATGQRWFLADLPSTATCPGCGWDGYSHDHGVEDGPRDGCCTHTCGRCSVNVGCHAPADYGHWCPATPAAVKALGY